MAKLPRRITAKMPVLLREEHRRTTKKRYLTLVENQRFYRQYKGDKLYFEVLPPHPNPYLKALIDKLHKRKILFSREIVTENGIDYVVIKLI